ncbi:MAG: archaeal proteasome endopeptidase complex subunit beta, partial [Candidatus Micrarchaeota archaeon]
MDKGFPFSTFIATPEAISLIAKDVPEYKPLKGTTTVGIIFDKGVVVAADKRATMGSFIAAKEVDKVHIVGDKMALTIAGGVGDAQVLVRLLKAELELYKYSKGKPMAVQAAATLLANVLQGNKYYPYMVQLIVAGFDEKPALFDLDPFGGLIPEKYVSTGSGSITAYGLLDEYYKDNMTRDDAVRLAVKAINSAMKRDSATGEGVDAIVITADQTKRLSKEEVEALLKPAFKKSIE